MPFPLPLPNNFDGTVPNWVVCCGAVIGAAVAYCLASVLVGMAAVILSHNRRK